MGKISGSALTPRSRSAIGRSAMFPRRSQIHQRFKSYESFVRVTGNVNEIPPIVREAADYHNNLVDSAPDSGSEHFVSSEYNGFAKIANDRYNYLAAGDVTKVVAPPAIGAIAGAATSGVFGLAQTSLQTKSAERIASSTGKVPKQGFSSGGHVAPKVVVPSVGAVPKHKGKPFLTSVPSGARVDRNRKGFQGIPLVIGPNGRVLGRLSA